MNRREVEARVRDITFPALAPALRDRVLAAAVVTSPRIGWSDRMWFSRSWRLTALGAVLAIFVLDHVSKPPRPPVPVLSAQVLAEAQVVEETSREVGLPADMAASLARRVTSRATQAQPRSSSALLQEMETGTTGGER